jgi:excinuclease UvrABC nuclease subunit
MKDRLGRVIYIGKAVNLRSRASSYFNSAAATDRRAHSIEEDGSRASCSYFYSLRWSRFH